MSRRGTSSGGGASSLGYLFGSDATSLARPNNRAPPRPPPDNMSTGEGGAGVVYTGSSYPPAPARRQQFEPDYATGYETPTSGYETPTGYQTPTGGYPMPRADSGSGYAGAVDMNNSYNGNYSDGRGTAAAGDASQRNNYAHHQTRAAGKVINDGGGVSLDMSGGSMGRDNNYFRADGQNSGNFITGRPSTRVQAAPGGGSSLGYLFGGA